MPASMEALSDDPAVESVLSGPVATEWTEIAQVFAGASGTGRKPGQLR
jgi:hypothetical protein